MTEDQRELFLKRCRAYGDGAPTALFGHRLDRLDPECLTAAMGFIVWMANEPRLEPMRLAFERECG